MTGVLFLVPLHPAEAARLVEFADECGLDPNDMIALAIHRYLDWQRAGLEPMPSSSARRFPNKKGAWNLKTPGSVLVEKSNDDLVVRCEKEGVKTGSTTSPSVTNAGKVAWDSVKYGLLFGPISVAASHSDGSLYDYPDFINVLMGIDKIDTPAGGVPK